MNDFITYEDAQSKDSVDGHKVERKANYGKKYKDNAKNKRNKHHNKSKEDVIDVDESKHKKPSKKDIENLNGKLDRIYVLLEYGQECKQEFEKLIATCKIPINDQETRLIQRTDIATYNSDCSDYANLKAGLLFYLVTAFEHTRKASMAYFADIKHIVSPRRMGFTYREIIGKLCSLGVINQDQKALWENYMSTRNSMTHDSYLHDMEDTKLLKIAEYAGKLVKETIDSLKANIAKYNEISSLNVKKASNDEDNDFDKSQCEDNDSGIDSDDEGFDELNVTIK